jgi:YidC/Oxa1 family membrane protein insertase
VLNWLYTAISWIMLRWHDVWSFLGDREVLGTNWDWILAIVFLVITVRLILFPLFVKQIKSQRAMQALQPEMKKLQDKHKGDRETLQKEMMELYRREKANPLMGCLPLLLQVPVFISLFWILRRLDPSRPAQVEAGEIGLEESKITLYGWTLEKFEDASLATLFKAPIASQFFDNEFGRFAALDTNITTVRIVTGVLVVIMMVTTHLTAKQMILKTGWATDPTQLMMQRLMVYGLPFFLLFSGAFFPMGVIIYWVVQNVFSLGQQQWVLRKYPPPPTAALAGGGLLGGGKPGGAGQQARGGRQQPGKQQPGKQQPGKQQPGKQQPGKQQPGKQQPGKRGGGPDGKAPEAPAVDGRKLAPKPGAKPVNPKKVPPKRVPSKSIPPKRKSSAPPRKG